MMNLKELLSLPDPVTLISDPDFRQDYQIINELALPERFNGRAKENLTHSIKVLQNSITRSPEMDIVLRTAALFHDVAKPATAKIDKEHGVTFRNHEVVGAAMMKKELQGNGYTEAEIADIVTLIRLHMRCQGYSKELWTESSHRRLFADVGSMEQFERLITIFYSDRTGNNPVKARRHEAMIAELHEETLLVVEKDAHKALRPALNGHEVMELTGLTPGKQLGMIMKELNKDENLLLDRQAAMLLVLGLMN